MGYAAVPKAAVGAPLSTKTATCGKPICTWDAFGPKTYTRPPNTQHEDDDRDDKDRVVFTDTFSVQNTATKYSLHVIGDERTRAVIVLNGKRIIDEDDFQERYEDKDGNTDGCKGRGDKAEEDCEQQRKNRRAEQITLDRPVTLKAANTLEVSVLGQPGSSIIVSVIGIDNDPPLISAVTSPSANNFGWNNTDVVVTFTCSDATSGIASCPTPVTVSSEGASQIVTGTAADLAGNTATISIPLSIDKTQPSITASVVPAANSFGVVTAPATINFACSDALSGVATCPSSIQVATAGLNEVFTGAASDKAGNTASARLTLSVQSTPLAIVASASPAPNANNWNNTAVTVSFLCTGGVAPVQCPAAQTLITEGIGQIVTGTATDATGQTASASVTLNIDRTFPSISATVTPTANSNGVVTAPAVVNFICSDSLSGVPSCPDPIQITTAGLNQAFSGTATDNAGNTASASLRVNVQSVPLAINASASPAPNAAAWNNTDVTVSYTCLGGVPPLACPGPQVVSTEGASQLIAGTATDAAMQTATATVTLNIDKTPPTISVSSPTDGGNVPIGQITLHGLATDALSGVSTVACNGTPATITGTAFACQTSLVAGGNSVAIQATDAAGNSAISSLNLNFSTPINVQITAPTQLQLFSANPITVTGTVDKGNATVMVGNVTAAVNSGTFTAAGVTLRESKNLLTATAISPDGGVGSGTVTVFLDSTPPVVHIESPAEGMMVTTPQIDVMGNVNDLVTGTVNGDQVSVSVNGVTASVSNRSFAAHGILLVPGVNTINAVATDRAGNTSQHQVHVTLRQFGAQQTITVVSGGNQSGPISTVLPQPLVVRATDALGRPMSNVTLVFAVAKSDGLLISGQQSGRTLTVKTDANGNATAQFQLGSRNGAGINQIAVSALGFVGQAVFSADSTVGTATQIHTVSGEMQRGAVGQPLAEPLVAIVFDAGGNPTPGVPVTFTVQSGGGLINGQTTITQKTDTDGKVSVVLVLGQQAGASNNVVSASAYDTTYMPAIFTSSALVPGPVANTTLSGVVLDDANQPIVNATVSIKGTNLSAVTNTSGSFTITHVPVGDLILFVDGSTSTEPETYPTLSFQLATIAGLDNTLPGPIYLPAIDTDNSQVGGGDQDVILTMNGVPGVQYKVFAHSVTFPDGSHTGRLTLSQVHADKVPMTPPNGTAPRLVGTLQPAGVKFDPPIQMTLPNTEGLAPGRITELFSFHHDVEQFVTEGTAHVSEDGSVIVSDPGFGLTLSGWHGASGTPRVVAAAGGNPCPPLTLTAKADGKSKDFKLVDDTVSFTAKPNGACRSAQWDWDFGDNIHSSEQNPSHKYAQPKQYPVKVHVSCTTACSKPRFADASLNVTAIKMTLKEVNWTGSGQNTMTKTGSGAWESSPYGSEGDTTISNPVWQADDNGTATSSDPVSYVKSSQPTLTATFKIEPTLTEGVPATVRSLGDITGGDSISLDFDDKDFSLQGASISSPALPASDTISDRVSDVQTTMHWSISLDQGNTFKEIGTSDHRVFVTWATPGGFGTNPGVTARRIQKVVSINDGTDSVTTMAGTTADWLETNVQFNLLFNVDANGDGNSWGLLDSNPHNGCDCISLARFAVKMLRMTGIASAKDGVTYPTGGNPVGDTDTTTREFDANGRPLDFFCRWERKPSGHRSI